MIFRQEWSSGVSEHISIQRMHIEYHKHTSNIMKGKQGVAFSMHTSLE